MVRDKKINLIKPFSFEWDEGNKDKNVKKQKVKNSETEEVFANDPVIVIDESHSQTEDRYLAYGITNKGRRLVVSFTLRGEDLELIRCIMSRDQDKKERLYYEKRKRGDNKE